jgi:two-component sensor histidine kinase
MLQISSIKMVDTREYFLAIVSNIRSGFDKSVDIDLDIKFNLPLEQMIYCGLILNELVTNSFKYAFREAGEIKIKLYKEENLVKFIIEDNGVGLKEDSNSSLGLLIVETLVKNQLFGKIKIESKRGVKSIIEWKI